MKEEFTISLSEDDLTNLLDSNISADEFIRSVFLDEENSEVLQTSCLYYHHNKGGEPEIADFNIVTDAFDPQNLKGSIVCNFTVEHRHRGSKLNSEWSETVKWIFKIDQSKQLIQFVGEDVPITDK
ncbi:hypothetical protein IM792_08220 [Mucilaginibacter sp. JRF]|uniref:hypothetical protein n=1 Tax=Mucilaginibacter sp. JRF TaxID=2780088 RepID=UPI0018829E89|nr:hypothetical protein [Mucilaginibacter sp. JRF]MBE9584429.1 hypothetical protein [Mucilaginibacter sp. JRF]